MGYDRGSMKLVGARPGGSGFFHVCLPYDTPDGTYWMSEVKIVIRTASGWSLWRYLLTTLETMFRPGATRARNLMLVGPGVSRLTRFPGHSASECGRRVEACSCRDTREVSVAAPALPLTHRSPWLTAATFSRFTARRQPWNHPKNRRHHRLRVRPSTGRPASGRCGSSRNWQEIRHRFIKILSRSLRS